MSLMKNEINLILSKNIPLCVESNETVEFWHDVELKDALVTCMQTHVQVYLIAYRMFLSVIFVEVCL